MHDSNRLPAWLVGGEQPPMDLVQEGAFSGEVHIFRIEGQASRLIVLLAAA